MISHLLLKFIEDYIVLVKELISVDMLVEFPFYFLVSSSGHNVPVVRLP